jgi:hypothetical protein
LSFNIPNPTRGLYALSQYVGKMKALTDDMESAGKKLDDEDLVGYILVELDSVFHYVISVVTTHVETISGSELYGQLVYHE